MTAKTSTLVLLLITLGAWAAPAARGQVPFDEAERRLKQKLATRPTTTQPTSDVERLREENLRLRERVMSLQQEVTVLKESLARARPATQPAGAGATTTAAATTEPAAGPARLVIGRWRGGDNLAGSSYILTFGADGSYRRSFLFNNQTEVGHFRVSDEGTMEMWTSTAADDRKHNLYRVNVNASQMTLTPTTVDGAEVKFARPLMLQRAD